MVFGTSSKTTSVRTREDVSTAHSEMVNHPKGSSPGLKGTARAGAREARRTNTGVILGIAEGL